MKLTKLQRINAITSISILVLGGILCFIFSVLTLINAVEIDREHPAAAAIPFVICLLLIAAGIFLFWMATYFAKSLIELKHRKVLTIKYANGKAKVAEYDPILDAIGEDED